MNWFRRSKALFPAKKRILLTNFNNTTTILEVDECQCGMIVKRCSYDDSILILKSGGTVYGDDTYSWCPYSGFTKEELSQDLIFRKRKDE
jgi:hypothetical protein